jgi:hypothetical protein
VVHDIRRRIKCLQVLGGQTSLKKYHSEDVGVDHIIILEWMRMIGWERVD